MNRLKSTASLVRRNYERVAERFETGVTMLERRYTPLGRFTPGPFEGWRFLWQPAALGFVAMSLILAGCSFTNSPFKLDMPNTWFYGEPSAKFAVTPSETRYILSVVLVYGGLLLLMRVWLRLAEIMKLHPGAKLKSLWWMLLLWATPMIVAPPLFSRDVYSYAAQGEMTFSHISPYLFGPLTLGSGPYVNPVDPLWYNSPAPYGPFFLFLDGKIDWISDHHELWTVVGLRLLETFAVAMIGYGVVMLARGLEPRPRRGLRALGDEPAGPAHVDRRRAQRRHHGRIPRRRDRARGKKHPVWALVFCSCAAAIKAPAAIGLAFVAWTWLGPEGLHPRSSEAGRDRVHRRGRDARRVDAARRIRIRLGQNLLSNGTVRSWAAPATAVGLALTNTLHAIGFHGIETGSVLSVTRLIGLLTAAGFGIWLLWHAEERGWVRSLALSLILFVELGPVVQPWYLAWGLVLLAASYKGREHFWLLALSMTGPFIGLPGGRALLADLVHSNPLLIAVAVAILGGLFILPMGRWTQWSWPAQETASESSLPIAADQA